MSDHINIRRIGVFAYHGVHAEESRLGQRFFISLDLELDLKPAGESDAIEKSVCYATVCERVQEIAVGQRFQTIEALAEALARMCLMEFPLIETVSVEVEKPCAPIAAILDSVCVLIKRHRHG